MCTQGRNAEQITGRKDLKQTARYPRLLDSTIIMIANAGLDRANKNYQKKYNELVAEALEAQNDSIKAATCAAFPNSTETIECKETETSRGTGAFALTKTERTCETSNPYAGLFNNKSQAGIINGGNVYATKYVIRGADIEKSVQIASKGHGEFILTDGKDNMLGSVSMNAVYSSENNTCTLTTTTLTCKNAKEVITTDVSCYAGGGGAGIASGSNCNLQKEKSSGWGMTGGGSTKMSKTQDFAGTVCTEFRSPEVTTQSIKM